METLLHTCSFCTGPGVRPENWGGAQRDSGTSSRLALRPCKDVDYIISKSHTVTAAIFILTMHWLSQQIIAPPIFILCILLTLLADSVREEGVGSGLPPARTCWRTSGGPGWQGGWSETPRLWRKHQRNVWSKRKKRPQILAFINLRLFCVFCEKF